MASSCTDLAGARFWIGSRKIWDEQSYVVKPWGAQFFDHLAFTLLSNKSCTNFELHKFFLSPKKCASQGLTVWGMMLFVNDQIFLVLAMFFGTSSINLAESDSLKIRKVSKLQAFDLFFWLVTLILLSVCRWCDKNSNATSYNFWPLYDLLSATALDSQFYCCGN